MLVLAVAASAVICSRINSAPSEKTVPVYEKDRQKGKGRKSSRERGKRDLKLSSTWHRCKRVSLSWTLVLVKGKIPFYCLDLKSGHTFSIPIPSLFKTPFRSGSLLPSCRAGGNFC